MKAGFWTAPEGAEQPINVFPIGEESLDAPKGSLTAAGALAKLATLDSAELAKSCPNAVALLSKVADAIAGQRADAPTQLFRLDNLNDLESRLVADVLGEGEVGGVVALPDGSLAQIQESVLAGIWRVRLETDAGHEYLEIGAVPEIVKRAAVDLTAADFEIGQVQEGVMNVLPELIEAFQGRLRGAIIARSDESALASFSIRSKLAACRPSRLPLTRISRTPPSGCWKSSRPISNERLREFWCASGRRRRHAAGMRHLLDGVRSGGWRRRRTDCARHAVRGAAGGVALPELRRAEIQIHGN